MIYRLIYCNKDGVQARVDIQKGSSTPVIDVEGTERPFVLSYNNDKGDKSGMFLSSSADIEIYETTDFNINNLKTSNETELSVTHYINNVISWQGFIIPDFFSIEVRNNPVITMTASDRLGTLKNITLSDLPSMISLRELAILCLNKTGLSLPLRNMADFSNGTGVNDFFNSKILTQRLSDTKGRSISCYDILSSILTASNSFLVQRSGAWHIINKIQHEAGSGKLYTGATSFINWSDVISNFSDISIGGRRTIIPVASTVGVFHEFGGGRLHPENYDFSLNLTGWTAVNGFVAVIDNRKVDNFVSGTGVIPQEWTTDPVFGDPTEKKYLVNDNYGINYDFANKPYLRSSNIPVTYPNISQVKVNVEVNATGPYIDSETYRGETNFAVIASNGTSTLHLTGSGTFEPLSGDPFLHKVLFDGDTHLQAVTSSRSVNGVLAVQEGNLSGYNITVRIYGYTKGVTGGRFLVTTLVNSVAVTITDISDEAKGILYKTERTDNYTKAHDIDTSLFADYLTTGLNGYFYSFPIDDTSLLYNSNNELTSKWTAYNDTEQLPLLQHITRQRSRLFSVAHDLLSAELEVNNFDPLAIFVSCDKRYTVVSAQFDFFKSNLSVELEEVAFKSATVRDFIYSYFGEGESGIKSIGGISAGGSGGGTGGGLTPEQLEILSWWKKDPDNPNTIYTEMNAYSMGELSAYGIGSGGSSGGGVDLLQAWTDYDSAKDNWAVKAGLLVPFYNDTRSRLTSLEGGAALSLSTVGTGNGIANITKSGTVLTVTKSNFAELDVNGKVLSSQLPSYVDDVLEYVNMAAFPATGETGKIYIAQDSNKTYRWSGTAYVEISASLALGETSSTAYRGDRGKMAYDHSQTEHQAIINGTGFVKANGKTLSYDNNSYSLASHNHSGVYEPVFTKNTAFNKNFGTAAGTVAEGNHTHNYLPLNTLRPTVDLNTLYTSGIAGGGSSQTTNRPSGSYSYSPYMVMQSSADRFVQLWFDSYGGNNIYYRNGTNSVWGDWVTLHHTGNFNPSLKLDKSVFDDLFEKVEVSTGVFAIKAKYNFYGVGEISAYGSGTGGSGGGSYDRLDAWVDYDSTKSGWVLSALLGVDLNTRVGNLEGGSALTVNTTGTGNAITSISKAGTVITATKGLTFSLDGHTHAYLPLAGGTMSNTNLVTNLNADLLDGLHKTAFPQYFHYGTTSSGSGWYKIKLLSTTSWMAAITVKLYQSYGYDEIIFTGYQYGSNYWHFPNAILKTSSGTSITVHFGYDSVNNLWVAVPAGNYTGMDVHVTNGYCQVADWSKNISVTKEATLTGTIQKTQTIYRPLNYNENASSATKLQTARTIAGVSFDGTANIAIPFANLSSKPTTLGGYGITDAMYENNNRGGHDLNTLKTQGFYALSGNPLNAPAGSDYSNILVVQSSSDRFAQMNFQMSYNEIYYRNGTGGTTTWGSWRQIAFRDSNVASATKLQTARTIAGVSFDGTANIAIPFANLSSKPTTLGGYGITDAVTLNTAQTITGAKTFTASVTAPTFIGALNGNAATATKLQTARTIWGQSFKGDANVSGAMTGVTTLAMTGALSGATTITASISVTTPKVIFAAAGWSMEQVGSELQMKYNNVLKMRFTSTGSIIATEEITAFA